MTGFRPLSLPKQQPGQFITGNQIFKFGITDVFCGLFEKELFLFRMVIQTFLPKIQLRRRSYH